MLGKVAVEEWLVDADILVGTYALALYIQIHHPIDQQERVTMRQVLTYFVDVHHVQRSL
ncbi:hypothetical protein D3C80_2091920 [compost metagenome]